MSLQGVLVVTHDNHLIMFSPHGGDIIESFGKFDSSDDAVDYAKKYRANWLKNRRPLVSEKDMPIEISGNYTLLVIQEKEFASYPAMGNMGWRESDWPDWGDAQKRVEIQRYNGSTIRGVLEIHDVFFDGESEIPGFIVRDDEGNKRSFADNKRWRFLDK